MSTGFSRGQSGRDVALTTHPHLAPSFYRKSRAIPPFPFWAFVACSRVNFTLLYLIIYRNFTRLLSNLLEVHHQISESNALEHFWVWIA